MLAEVFGIDGLIILVPFVGLGVILWAVIDILSRPGPQFRAVGSSKATWLIWIIVLSLLTGIIGWIVSIVYLTAIRPRVKRAASAIPPPNQNSRPPGRLPSPSQ